MRHTIASGTKCFHMYSITTALKVVKCVCVYIMCVYIFITFVIISLNILFHNEVIVKCTI